MNKINSNNHLNFFCILNNISDLKVFVRGCLSWTMKHLQFFKIFGTPCRWSEHDKNVTLWSLSYFYCWAVCGTRSLYRKFVELNKFRFLTQEYQNPCLYQHSVWCCYITVDPETNTHHTVTLFDLISFLFIENQNYSKHDKKCCILIFYHRAVVKQDHYMAHLLS